jgi:hypothetical protein
MQHDEHACHIHYCTVNLPYHSAVCNAIPLLMQSKRGRAKVALQCGNTLLLLFLATPQHLCLLLFLAGHSWSPTWGLEGGSFNIAYGSALVMQPDIAYALEFYNASIEAHAAYTSQRVVPNLSVDSSKPDCLLYKPQQPQRLIKLVEDLNIIVAQAENRRRQIDESNRVLVDVVVPNVGFVKSLSAAGKGPFRICGSTAAALKPLAAGERLHYY